MEPIWTETVTPSSFATLYFNALERNPPLQLGVVEYRAAFLTNME